MVLTEQAARITQAARSPLLHQPTTTPTPLTPPPRKKNLSYLSEVCALPSMLPSLLAAIVKSSECL